MHVGLRGWAHPALIDAYYPEDLPEEWRLGYYANEFLATLVPWAGWRELTPGLLTQAVDDTPERFRFYCEIPAGSLETEALEKARALGARFAGGVRWGQDAPGGLRSGRVCAGCADAGASVWLFEGAEAPALPALRRLLETVLDQGDAPVAVFLTPSAAAPEQARQVQIIGDLLGMAD